MAKFKRQNGSAVPSMGMDPTSELYVAEHENGDVEYVIFGGVANDSVDNHHVRHHYFIRGNGKFGFERVNSEQYFMNKLKAYRKFGIRTALVVDHIKDILNGTTVQR